MKEILPQLQHALASHLDEEIEIRAFKGVGGGCIHSANRITTNVGDFFVKHNRAEFAPAFEAEAQGLLAIQATRTLRVPQVILQTTIGSSALLVLEFVPFASGSANAAALMGEHLARLHACEAPCYGWDQDNFLGPTPQPNPKSDDWIAFFRDRRLGHLQSLLAQRGIHLPELDRLREQLSGMFHDATLRPSLLHGDLWSGNAAFARNGEPIVFDPACYWGHAEADLAMTRLFGGFTKEFYDAYASILPIPDGFSRRCELYNLYHLLNHALIFGGSYLAQSRACISNLMR